MSNTLDQIRLAIADDLSRLTARIDERLATGNPMLQAIVKANMRTKGKLVRPITVILTARLLGQVNDKVIDSAAAVELLHNASLVHDDVVDHSSTRRGEPTINAVWNNHIAVLVGDYYVSTSMQLAINTGNLHIIEAVCDLGRRLSLGELDQIYNARYHTLTEEAYYQIIDFKTASLFKACARMAAASLDVDDRRSQALVRFAELLGLCFQIRDDIFDYFDDAAIGKPTGNDLREGKVTLPLLHVLLHDDSPEHNDMVTLAQADTLTDGQIGTLMAYARNRGGIEYAYAAMQRMRDEAVQCLQVFDDCREKQWLTDLMDYIIARTY